MSPKIITGILSLVLLIVLCVMGVSMKRDLPFQEIIPLDGGIGVINAGEWFNESLQISLISNNKKITGKNYDKDGICLFKGLDNDNSYTIEIKRTDLKGRILYKKSRKKITPKRVKYFVLAGASVGRSWSFDKLAERIDFGQEVVLGNRTKYDFDKSSCINALIKTPVPVTGVIIKECAAYFPRDIEPCKKMIKTWVDQLRSRGIAPILATVVPVTKAHDKNHSGRHNSILEFNDFIRLYAGKQKILVFDLEKAVRISEKDRHLREEYAQPDGLHLAQKAYDEALDGLAVSLIKNF